MTKVLISSTLRVTPAGRAVSFITPAAILSILDPRNHKIIFSFGFSSRYNKLYYIGFQWLLRDAQNRLSNDLITEPIAITIFPTFIAFL